MPAQLDRFVCLGDSLTELSWDEQGLGASLAHLYQRKLDVLNRGLSGYNSDWGLHVWKQWLEPTTADGPKTQLVTLWLGANDAVLPNELQAVPLDRFKANLRAIVALVHERCPEASIVLITPTPFHPEGWLDERMRRGLTREHDRARERTSEYAEAVRQLGRELHLPVADAYTPVDAEMRQLGPDKEGTVFTDGLHLNSGAYKHVVNAVVKVIESHYPDKAPDALPLLFPYWRDIPIAGALGPEFSVADKAVAAAAAHRTDPF